MRLPAEDLASCLAARDTGKRDHLPGLIADSWTVRTTCHGEADLRVQIVFVDADKRLCIGRCSATQFLLLETTGPQVVRSGDTLTANFSASAMAEVFNETRGSLLQMKVLKKFTRLDDAIRAAKEHDARRSSRLVR